MENWLIRALRKGASLEALVSEAIFAGLVLLSFAIARELLDFSVIGALLLGIGVALILVALWLWWIVLPRRSQEASQAESVRRQRESEQHQRLARTVQLLSDIAGNGDLATYNNDQLSWATYTEDVLRAAAGHDRAMDFARKPDHHARRSFLRREIIANLRTPEDIRPDFEPTEWGWAKR